MSRLFWRRELAMRSRAAVVSAAGEGSASRVRAVRSRIICLRNLICLRYRAHQAQTSRCSLSEIRSLTSSRRSSDSDINGTISWQGCNMRSSLRLIAFLVLR